jgi:uncharacterized protein (TIGR00299 family) protein
VSAGEPGGGEPATLAWFHCFAGIAGDMALGALLDAGADAGEVTALLRRLPLPGWDLAVDHPMRGGITCTAAVVSVTGDLVARSHAAIVSLIGEARLPDRVADRALRTFRLLAEVEGALHGRRPEAVHFHEIGGHDSVVDVVGTAAALEVLGVDRVAASAVATGTGTVTTAHGVLPNPAPATVRLLRGIPAYGRDVRVELTTPTGAALLAALATSFGPMPAMRVTASGFGAGAGELDELPNCTEVVIGRVGAAPGGAGGQGGTAGHEPGQPVLVLEANLDDATGEQLAHAVGALLDAGAHDAWITPIVMKKGRPGHTVHVLGDPSLSARLRAVLRSTTGTFGVRAAAYERWPSARSVTSVEVDGEPVSMKVGPERAKPEFDDVVRAAGRTGATPREVGSRAEEAWRHRPPAG